MTKLTCKKCRRDIQISKFIHNGCLNGYNPYWFWCICDPENDLELKDINVVYEDDKD